MSSNCPVGCRPAIVVDDPAFNNFYCAASQDYAETEESSFEVSVPGGEDINYVKGKDGTCLYKCNVYDFDSSAVRCDKIEQMQSTIKPVWSHFDETACTDCGASEPEPEPIEEPEPPVIDPVWQPDEMENLNCPEECDLPSTGFGSGFSTYHCFASEGSFYRSGKTIHSMGDPVYSWSCERKEYTDNDGAKHSDFYCEPSENAYDPTAYAQNDPTASCGGRGIEYANTVYPEPEPEPEPEPDDPWPEQPDDCVCEERGFATVDQCVIS